jgi:hypothetical protein
VRPIVDFGPGSPKAGRTVEKRQIMEHQMCVTACISDILDYSILPSSDWGRNLWAGML